MSVQDKFFDTDEYTPEDLREAAGMLVEVAALISLIAAQVDLDQPQRIMFDKSVDAALDILGDTQAKMN